MELSETAKHAGLVHKLVRAFDAAKLDPRDLNNLAEDADRCRQLYGVMRGHKADCPDERRSPPLSLNTSTAAATAIGSNG